MPALSPWSAASVLSSPTALPHTLQSLLKALGNNFPADGIFVNTYYSETKEVHFLAHATHQSAQEIYDIVPLDRHKKSNAQTPSQDPVYRVDNIETDPFTYAVATQVIADIQSYVMVRLRLEGRHLGVACFYSRRPAAFNDAHVRQIEELRDLLSLQVGFALSSRIDRRNSKLESNFVYTGEGSQTGDPYYQDNVVFEIATELRKTYEKMAETAQVPTPLKTRWKDLISDTLKSFRSTLWK